MEPLVCCQEESKLFGCFKLNVLSNCQRFIVFERSSLKFNIPDTGIIFKWKKDFANFGLEGLQLKPKADQEP
jgi:transposase